MYLISSGDTATIVVSYVIAIRPGRVVSCRLRVRNIMVADTIKIASMRLYRVQIPMRMAFEHATRARERAQSIVCQITLADGIRGHGEGAPRPYVTGEDLDDCWRTLREVRLPAEFPVSADARALTRFVAASVARIADEPDQTIRNAARTALELALLDALGRSQRMRLSQLLGPQVGFTPPTRGRCHYSLVVGRGLVKARDVLVGLRDRYQYRAVKLKVGFGLDEDLANLRSVRDIFGADVDIRVDANRSWSLIQAREFLTQAHHLGVREVEDPVRGATLTAMASALRALRRDGDCRVILDEPVRTVAEARAAIAEGIVDVFNIRISKCGGLLESLRMASVARDSQIDIQLGCQVGETAILSAAGRIFAFAVDGLCHAEGSNEALKWLPEHHISAQDLTYGKYGAAPPLTGYGLAIDIIEERLAALASEIVEVPVTRYQA